jgi:cephalosporin-C deacetylase
MNLSAFVVSAAIVSALPLGVAATRISPVPPQAAARVAAVQVRVSLDHDDWTYRVGEPVNFIVSVVADNQPIEGVEIRYSTGPDMRPGPATQAFVPREGLVIKGGTLQEPGFLRCSVTAEVNGRAYRGVATAAFSPEKIVPTQVDPKDFDAYWSAQIAELAKIPLEPRITFLPDASTDKVNVYHVGIRTISGPEGSSLAARVYGILCEPKAPGKYPAVLKVPGAHVRPYFGDKDLAARGVITLEIGIEGIPVNMAKEVYDALDVGALNSYWLFNLESRDNYYYHRVFLGCIRANDFLASRESWDGKNMVVMGASQGGMLAIVTAALDPRVTGVQATHPAFCDVTADLHGRTGGFPRPFAPDLATGKASIYATPEKIATSAYYDTVNFARRLKVPGFYTWGYNDDVCPPTSTYAAYNVITASKTLAVTLELAHSYNQEQWEAINQWLLQSLHLN